MMLRGATRIPVFLVGCLLGVGLGKPAKPSEAQWTQLSKAAELCYFETSATGTSWSATYPQKIYGISLFVIGR